MKAYWDDLTQATKNGIAVMQTIVIGLVILVVLLGMTAKGCDKRRMNNCVTMCKEGAIVITPHGKKLCECTK